MSNPVSARFGQALGAARTDPSARGFPIHGPKRWAPYLLVLPSVLVLLGVMIYPIVYGVYISLFEYRMTQSLNWVYVGLNNYRRLFLQTPDFVNAVVVTAQFTVMTVTAEFAIGLGLALLLNMDFPGRALFRVLVLLPLMVPPLVSGLLWRVMYDNEFGVISYLIRSVGVEPPVFLGDRLLALPAVVATEVWRATPFMTLVILAALQAVPHELHEAAQVDGAGNTSRFRFISLPLILPVLLVALLFRTVDVLRTFDLVYLLTQGGPGSRTEVLGMYIYRWGFVQFNMGITSAAAMLLFLLTLGVCVVYLRLVVRGQALTR
ncbi:MAG: sugar ABC transporter permease [Chloroflexi bacterium]|nr:sugar ABC transporter permease [Chloroflexota bacterium]